LMTYEHRFQILILHVLSQKRSKTEQFYITRRIDNNMDKFIINFLKTHQHPEIRDRLRISGPPISITFIKHIWIKCTIDANWIGSILRIRTWINFHSTQCWNYWIRIVFYLVNHFHQSHLNQIHVWQELNQRHFRAHHFNQIWFQVMFKFLDQNVFHVVNHSHQFHLNQIHD
jgi:hypothetical protein